MTAFQYLNTFSNLFRKKDETCQNEINRLAAIMLFFLLAVCVSCWGWAFLYDKQFTLVFGGLSIIGLILVYLYGLQKIVLCKFLLSLILPFVFLFATNMFAVKITGFSYLFILLAFVPVLLLYTSKNRFLLSLVLLVYLVLFLFDGHYIIDQQMQFATADVALNAPIKIILFIGFILSISYAMHLIEKAENRSGNLSIILRETKEELASQQKRCEEQKNTLLEKNMLLEQKDRNIDRNIHELTQTKLAYLNTIEKLKNTRDRLKQQELEAKSILDALSEHYLFAQYNLDGELITTTKKVIELFGVIKNENFKSIEPVINRANNKVKEKLNGHYFGYVWKKIIDGEAQTLELEFDNGNNSKCLTTTFAPLFDDQMRVSKVLAIGQDITELILKSDKIDKINDELKAKIDEISQQNELLNFQQLEIFEKSQELTRQKHEIQQINESLELRVQERTKVLEAKNRQLAEYAFINSHVLRAPVSTMLGLINLISYTSLSKEDQNTYEHLQTTGKLLDSIVHKINKAIDDGFDFDRKYIEPEREFHAMQK